MTVRHPGEPLDDGQEEVFVREEFDTGRLEHHRAEETAALASGRSAPVIGSEGASTGPGFGDSPEQRPPHRDHNGQSEGTRMTDPHAVEDHRPSEGDRSAPRRRNGQPWLLAGLGVLILVAIACVMVWVNWTQDSARTGAREVQSDNMRLAAPAAGTSATTHPDSPTTAEGDPAPPKAGTDANVNDGPGGTPPPQS